LVEGLRGKFDFEVLCGPPLVVTESAASRPAPCPLVQVPTLRFPKRFLFARALNDLSFLILAFLRGLFLTKPDLIVSQTSPPGVWWAAFLLSRWHRVRCIHVSKDMFPDNWAILSGGKFGSFFSFLTKLNDWILRKADQIVVIGGDMKQRFLEKGFPAQQITQTTDWVDLDFIKPLPKKNYFSEKYGLADKFVILYGGNFGRIHNFEDVIAAAQGLQSEKKIQFVFVGEGASKKWLMHEVRLRRLDNVTLVPFEPRSKLPEVLASADAGVILLRRGMAGLSMPSKIYSLLASGRPILACVEGESDIAKIVHESESGFVIPPGNIEEFHRAIKTLFERRELRDRMGANARRFAEKKDFQKLAFKDYEDVFFRIMDRR